MIDNISKIELLVDEIGDTTEDEIEIYLIGGGAMMYHRYKAVTKDLDLVVMTEQEYGSLTNALESIGFQSDRPRIGME